MGPLVIISVIGGLILLISAILLIVILIRSHFGETDGRRAAALCACGQPARAGAAIAQRLRALERDRCWY